MNYPRTLAILAAVAITATGCSKAGDTAEPATPPPAAGAVPSTALASSGVEPHTEAAVRAAATEEFDSFAAGDYGATWDLYYTKAKKLISRADYIRLFKLCPDPAAGAKFQIEKITLDSAYEAHVRVSRLGLAVASYVFTYESGHWKFIPDARAMSDYRTKSVEQMARDQRAQGGCGKS
ncbi:hypothetical protein GCM10023191_101910 [Actinoallomurus oryzae]|uniref:Lipoprotein n=1 Tax=Actinoallomurus oryzae TaxID=502180 RepID=A0ABP8R9M3_9ACTN